MAELAMRRPPSKKKELHEKKVWSGSAADKIIRPAAGDRRSILVALTGSPESVETAETLSEPGSGGDGRGQPVVRFFVVVVVGVVRIGPSRHITQLQSDLP